MISTCLAIYSYQTEYESRIVICRDDRRDGKDEDKGR